MLDMNRLKTIRKQAGMTLKGVAEKFDVTPMTIQRFEKGTRNISLKWLEKLAALYGVTVPELIGEEPPEGKSPETALNPELLEEIVTYAMFRCKGQNVDPKKLSKVICLTYARCLQIEGKQKTAQIKEKVDDMIACVAA